MTPPPLSCCQMAMFIIIIAAIVVRMIATLTKLGEGAFADVFGCQKEGWDRLAIKVSVQQCLHFSSYTSRIDSVCVHGILFTP